MRNQTLWLGSHLFRQLVDLQDERMGEVDGLEVLQVLLVGLQGGSRLEVRVPALHRVRLDVAIRLR